MSDSPPPRDICTVVVRSRGGFTPVVGLNQTPGGFFVNFYLNTANHPFFGDYEPPHISRHQGLIAARYTERTDIFSSTQGVVSIDERKTPEELPWCSITSDLYLAPIGKSSLKSRVDQPLVVPARAVPEGILVRVKVWPRLMDPTADELTHQINHPPNPEPLVATFVPSGFTNPVGVGVFAVDVLMRDMPFFIDEMVVSSPDDPTDSPPVTVRGPRVGRM